MSTESFRPTDDGEREHDHPRSLAGETGDCDFAEFCGAWKVRCEGPQCDGVLVTKNERERCGCRP